MKRVEAKKVYYVIKETLGGGLTSQVYKAFRQDCKGITRQEVALKIIHSKKDVQILKQEFEALSKVRSKYCVRILAWENLSKGPALVLEYIDGVTLHEFLEREDLMVELSKEILVQIHLGLVGLHRCGLFHGDLNLRNIMVNTEGLVKIIDFGFGDGIDEQCMTPHFSSPQRLSGQPPSTQSDLFALNKIANIMLKKEDSDMGWKKRTTRAHRRRAIGSLVEKIKKSKVDSTQRVTRSDGQISRGRKRSPFASVASFLFCLFIPVFFQSEPQKHSLRIGSEMWFRYSINDMPMKYGPAEQRLRAGKYKLSLETSAKKFNQHLDLSKPETFLLQLNANSL